MADVVVMYMADMEVTYMADVEVMYMADTEVMSNVSDVQCVVYIRWSLRVHSGILVTVIASYQSTPTSHRHTGLISIINQICHRAPHGSGILAAAVTAAAAAALTAAAAVVTAEETATVAEVGTCWNSQAASPEARHLYSPHGEKGSCGENKDGRMERGMEEIERMMVRIRRG